MGLIDRVGRRPLLLAGSIGMVITLSMMAIIFGLAPESANGKPVISHGAGIAGLIAANLYIVSFGVSWGPVVWVLLGEMFPNRLRGAALAVSGAANWAANFAVTVTFLPLLRGAGLGWAYGHYAFASLLSLLFVRFAVRETKGRTLEEM
jgi:MFS family permease